MRHCLPGSHHGLQAVVADGNSGLGAGLGAAGDVTASLRHEVGEGEAVRMVRVGDAQQHGCLLHLQNLQRSKRIIPRSSVECRMSRGPFHSSDALRDTEAGGAVPW